MKLLFAPRTVEQGQAGWPEGAIQAERDLGDLRHRRDEGLYAEDVQWLTKLSEGASALAFAVAENPRHRDFEIVI